MPDLAATIRLDQCSREFVLAFAKLMRSIRYADESLLEGSIAAAHAEMIDVLQRGDYLGFENEAPAALPPIVDRDPGDETDEKE